VLDMDSSESPTYGEQEGGVYNGHFGCTCYHPLLDSTRSAMWSDARCGRVTSIAPTAGAGRWSR
jgi:Transposase DDE domain group 1